jgi:hypothetical protein
VDGKAGKKGNALMTKSQTGRDGEWILPGGKKRVAMVAKKIIYFFYFFDSST